MAIQTPIKYDASTKKHSIFSATDTIDPTNLPATSVDLTLAGTVLSANVDGVTDTQDLASAITAGQTSVTAGAGIAVSGVAQHTVSIATTGATTGQVLSYNGTIPTWATPSSTPLATVAPPADTVTTGAVGVSTKAAKEDHSHPFTQSLALTQAGGLVYTHNGDAKTVSIPSGTIAQTIGFNSAGSPVYEAAQIRGKYIQNATQSVAAAGVVTAIFGALQYANGVGTTANGFVIQTAGTYHVGAAVHFTAGQSFSHTANGTFSIQHFATLNGTLNSMMGRVNMPNVVNADGISFSGMATLPNLSVGDVVTCTYFNTYVGSKNTDPNGASHYFWIQKA